VDGWVQLGVMGLGLVCVLARGPWQQGWWSGSVCCSSKCRVARVCL